jgi:hypothetical protein
MLGGRMSNQDEDEVEDELDALEQEVGPLHQPYTLFDVYFPRSPSTPIPDQMEVQVIGTPATQHQLPSAPTTDLPPVSEYERQHSKAEARRARARERAKERAEPMLA